MNQPQSSNEGQRPLITFALFAYNQEQFIAEAVRGALVQSYTPLEIILSDDYSLDETFNIIKRLSKSYEGDHQVIIRQNEENLGLSEHINQVMSIAHGELIVLAAGDDISLSNRVERIYKAYTESGKRAFSIYSSLVHIDEQGNQYGTFTARVDSSQLTLEQFAKRNRGVIGSTQAVNRSLFDFFGPLDKKVIHEDWVLPFRAALLGSVCYIDAPLVYYRKHTNNIFKGGATSVDDLRRLQRKYIVADMSACENCLNDTYTYLTYFPEKAPELKQVINDLKLRIREFSDESQMLNASLWQKLKIISRAGVQGTSPRRLSRWALQHLFPSIEVIRQRRINVRQG